MSFKDPRRVLCTQCYEYVNKGYDLQTSSALRQHQRRKVCRLRSSIITIEELLPPAPSPLHRNCQGAVFHWELGSPYQTYPFPSPIHDPASRFKPGYNLIFIDPQGPAIHVHSLSCTRIPLTSSGPCLHCEGTVNLVDKVKDRARQPVTELDRAALSPPQLRQKIECVEKALKKETLKRLIVHPHDDDVFLS